MDGGDTSTGWVEMPMRSIVRIGSPHLFLPRDRRGNVPIGIGVPESGPSFPEKVWPSITGSDLGTRWSADGAVL